MANWNDPQPRQTGFGSTFSPGFSGQVANADAGLRRYMLSIYNYMTSGVLLSGVIALVFAQSGLALALFATPLRWLVALAPLGFVMAMGAGFTRWQTSTLKLLYWAFCGVMGMSLSAIFFVYTGPSIAATFFATAGAFAGLSLVGYTTKRSLSAMGAFMTMGLFGLVIAMIINRIWPMPGLGLAISVLGVVIFAGLTAWDTQRLKDSYYQVAGSEYAERLAIMGALTLYLDFINLFQFLLRFMGDRR